MNSSGFTDPQKSMRRHNLKALIANVATSKGEKQPSLTEKQPSPALLMGYLTCLSIWFEFIQLP